jgi:hypothetical protein
LNVNIEEFSKILDGKGYPYTVADGKIEVKGGYVNLRSLTALPEGTTFGNSGSVYLSSLTTLPEGTTFGNGGGVYLSSLTDEYQTYRDQRIRLRVIDGYTMLILSERQVGDATVCHARYFGGGDLGKLETCYIATFGEYSAHGGTIEQAVRDARFKADEQDFDAAELIETIQARGTVEFNDFRLLTGACESGLRHGMQEAGLDPDADDLPLATVLEKAHGSFGRAFRAHFAGVAT